MGYYVLQVYIPCIMLVILSWVSFFLNREATSDRSNIGIMCVLSLATLSFDVRNDIPSVPYVTALDWFLIMCYLFLFASLLEFAVVHYFTKVGYGDFYMIDTSENLLSENETTSNLYEENLYETRNQPKLRFYLRSFWKCINSDPIYKMFIKKRANSKGINSVSRCDKVSRILFPALFLLLNVIYWNAYYIKA